MSELTRVVIKTPRRGRTNKPRITFSEQGRTHQEFKEDCDVNNIVNTWRNTGETPHLMKGNPFYGDFTGPTELQEALNLVSEAQGAFDELPAAVRDHCQNSPVEFMHMLNSETQREALLDAGLRIEDPESKIVPTSPTTPAEPTETAENSPEKEGE